MLILLIVDQVLTLLQINLSTDQLVN